MAPEAAPAGGDRGNAAIIHTAHLDVFEANIESFRNRLLMHAATSRAEPGCLRFDVYQEVERPGTFLLFEVYRDAAALEAHRASVHFAAFRRDVEGWVAERRWWTWNGPLASRAQASP
ncbi:MAG TPA: putative quinol monooxygenase [Casimicrobiaceae bacterium]|nr:putative quinol monooxygenase [Casimicrobiaceae bacterium]